MCPVDSELQITLAVLGIVFGFVIPVVALLLSAAFLGGDDDNSGI